MGLKSNDSCLAKVKEDEPIFVLRGQDASSPRVILHWISKNFGNVEDDKLREAFEQALKMKHYPRRRTAD